MEKNVLFYLFALILIVTVVQSKICWKNCSGQFRKQSKGWFTYQKLIYLLVASISEATLVTTISTTDSWNLVPIQ